MPLPPYCSSTIMPMNPNSPNCRISSVANCCALSRAMMVGFSTFCAKSRAASRTAMCSSLRSRFISWLAFGYPIRNGEITPSFVPQRYTCLLRWNLPHAFRMFLQTRNPLLSMLWGWWVAPHWMVWTLEFRSSKDLKNKVVGPESWSALWAFLFRSLGVIG